MNREVDDSDDSTKAILAAMRNVSAAMTAQAYFEHLVEWMDVQLGNAETFECRDILSRALRLAESYSSSQVRKLLEDTDNLLVTALTGKENPP